MDREEFFERQIKELGERIAALEGDVAALSSLTRHPVEKLLWQLGFPVMSHGGGAQLLFSPAIANSSLSRFYQMMKRYSFRLFVRELIQSPEGSDLGALTRYCSAGAARAYLDTLAGLGIVSLGDRGYRLLRKVPSFGRTLEWYVCEILEREFLAPALFNVKLENTLSGGDYDVLSAVAGRPVYVEVKSSPPRGVEREAVQAFLGRVLDLCPGVAVLLVDTELRMSDKLVPLLAAGLEREGKSGPDWAVARLVNEIFHVRHSIYVTNSRKGIYSNLRICFRDFLAREGQGGKR
ncbi:MAG: hypothetical protein P4L43_13680 [Syntrophobacteraceae bacterium]|nr:hypothetical protein [Syntrophobacteraceae bacterium]